MGRFMTFLAKFVCVAAVLAGAGAYYLYDQDARKQLAHVDEVAGELIEQHDFAAAENAYREFLKQFPLTLASNDAKSKLAAVETREKQYRAALLEKRLEKPRRQYRAGFENYKTYVKNGQLERALEQLESVKDLAEQAGQPADLNWMLQVNLAGEMRALKGLLRTGQPRSR